MSNVRGAKCTGQTDSDLAEMLAHILVSGGPPEFLARVRWPMHKALAELFDETGRAGQRELLGAELELRPSREGGLAVEGLDRALDELVRSAVLDVQGQLRDARLALSTEAAVRLRRELMLLSPDRVALYRRAGARWAALASTAAKNRSTAIRSSASAVKSSTPKREGELVVETC